MHIAPVPKKEVPKVSPEKKRKAKFSKSSLKK